MLAREGVRPLEYMARLGWLGDDVWFAHGIHFNDEELRVLAKTHTGVAHCPISNMKLASGIARVPDTKAARDKTGSDAARWTGTNATNDAAVKKAPAGELTITQEMRQEGFDNWTTTDDHGMQIYGLAKDSLGNEYFMVKNSWGKYGKYDGIFYASKPYVAYKTMNILIHKDAIPAKIAKKLGLK